MTTVREVLADVEKQLREREAQLEAAQGRYEECFRIHEGLVLGRDKFGLDLDLDVDAVGGDGQ